MPQPPPIGAVAPSGAIRPDDADVWLVVAPDAHLGPAGTAGTALVVAARTLAHPRLRQPDGRRLAELVATAPGRHPHDLVFLSDLATEFAASGTDLATVKLDWEGVLAAVASLHARGELRALELNGLPADELELITRASPVAEAKVVTREELRERLRRRVLRARQRWYHPARRGFHPADPFL
jgi:hypothetical protein